MRAVLNSERFLNSCNPNSPKYYSKQNGIDQSNESAISAFTSKRGKEKTLLGKLLKFVKICTQQFQPQQIQGHNNKAKGNQPHGNDAQIPTVTVKHFTKPEGKAAQSANRLKDFIASFAKPQIKIINEEIVPLKVANTNQQNELPGNTKNCLLAFPVVPLNETLDRYLSSIRPFFNESTFRKEQELTFDFLRGKGNVLQSLLSATGKSEINWLAERWTHATHLRHRAPLTVFSSPCITFPNQRFHNIIECLDFAAKAIYGMCEFKLLVDNNQIPVYSFNGFNLDNSQFHNVFGTVRIPKRCCDVLQQYDSNYVIVIHKNNFYKLPVYTAKKTVISVIELRKQLLRVVQSARPAGPPIGLLTHDTRDNWCEAHEMLCRKENNAKAVQCIEQALFTVSLDEPVEVPNGQERSILAAQLLHGGGLLSNSANRWMDKTLQLIINSNGMAGFCYEQAPADPQPAATLMDYVQKHIANPKYGQDGGDTCAGNKLNLIHFAEIDGCIDFWLTAAKRSINIIANQLYMHVFQYKSYGRSVIKSKSLAPDSFIQMALQLAFYRLHKELPAHQESAHLRIFQFGRSEVIRSTSTESLKFIREMETRNTTPRTRLLALRAAVNYHQEQTKLAMQGHGVDRHLFGLKQMARENAKPLPKFFNSDGYRRSTNFRIVSSQLTTSHDAFMANGPYNSEGYGCCYNLRESDTIFAVSAWRQNPLISTERYGSEIALALDNMGQLILATSIH